MEFSEIPIVTIYLLNYKCNHNKYTIHHLTYDNI